MPALLLLDQFSQCPKPLLRTLSSKFTCEIATEIEVAAQSRYDLAVVIGSETDPLARCGELLDRGVSDSVILAGVTLTLEEARRAIRLGVGDIVTDLTDAETFVRVVAEAMASVELRAHLRRLRESIPFSIQFPDILGTSAPIRETRRALARAAESDSMTLITGEPGTGKSLLARRLHERSTRGDGSFVQIDCGEAACSVSNDELCRQLQSILCAQEPGNVDSCPTTVYLKGVFHLPSRAQNLVSRAARQHSERLADVACHSELRPRIIASGTTGLGNGPTSLGDDANFGFTGMQIGLHPLRERGTDVLTLAQYFLRRASTEFKPMLGMTPAAARLLMTYDWPGNVAELERCIARAAAVAKHDLITAADVVLERGVVRATSTSEREPPSSEELTSLRELERRVILDTLRTVNGNKTRAAKRLGVDRKTLLRKLQSIG